MEFSSNNNYFRDLFYSGQPFHWFGTVVTAVLFASLTALSIIYDSSLVAFGIAIALPVIYLIFKSPKLWIYLIVASTPIFFTSNEVGISTTDVVIGIFYIFGMFIWFFWHLFILKKKLVRNIGDWAILLFFTFLLLNSLIAIENGVEFFDWLRAYSMLSITLLYFPIREHFENKRDLQLLLFLFALSIVAVDIWQFYLYIKGVTQSFIYIYELGKSIRTNQSVITAAAFFGSALFFTFRKRTHKLLTLVFLIITLSALLASFSRAFWLIYIAGLCFLFVFLSLRQKFNLIIIFALISTIVTVITIFILSDNAGFMLQVVEKRIGSSTQGTADISVQSRLAEYEAAFADIQRHPIGGNGLEKEFHFYNPIGPITTRTKNIHNGYIFLAYKVGIPLTLIYIFFLLYYFVKSYGLIKFTKDPFYRSVAISGFLSLFLMLTATFATAVFNYRDGIFVILFSVACIGIAEKNIQSDSKSRLSINQNND